MTIFGAWLREKTRRIARATAGDKRAAAQLEAQDEADPLGVDLEATRQALEAHIRAEENRRNRELDEDRARRNALVQERKEQSIIAALVFGCSCGASWSEIPPDELRELGWSWDVGRWLREHAHCAGLGAMVREDA